MGALFRRRFFEEPAFGRWNFFRGSWWAAFELPGHADVVEIGVFGTKREPDPAGLALAVELPGRYGELVVPVQEALFEHYSPVREMMEAGGLPKGEVPLIDWAGGVWPHVQLEVVEVRRAPSRAAGDAPGGVADTSPVIEIVYSTAWDAEHALGARVQDWRLTELSGSV